jgi:putative effector of murein hydrolase
VPDRLTIVCAVTTIGSYVLARALAKRYSSPLTAPVFFSTVLIVCVLVAGDIQYEHYVPVRDLVTWFIGPATVALAVPVYQHRKLLIRYAAPALCGLAAGALATMLAALVVAIALRFSSELVRSIGVKSVTAPIAIELASLLHCDSSLTAGLVVATGLIGATFGPALLDRFGIHNPVARGLSLGTIAHGQGTAQAMLEGELQGAAAVIGTVLAAILVSFLAPPILRPLTAGRAMSDSLFVLLQLGSVGLLGWGAFLCLARRDRRQRAERRADARERGCGRRRSDVLTRAAIRVPQAATSPRASAARARW